LAKISNLKVKDCWAEDIDLKIELIKSNESTVELDYKRIHWYLHHHFFHRTNVSRWRYRLQSKRYV